MHRLIGISIVFVLSNDIEENYDKLSNKVFQLIFVFRQVIDTSDQRTSGYCYLTYMSIILCRY